MPPEARTAAERFRAPAVRGALALSLITAGLAGCGGGRTSTGGSPAGASAVALQVASSACSSSSSAGSSAASSAANGGCTFVLSDGRRLRCSAMVFGHSPPAIGKLEHDKQCAPAGRLPISAAMRKVFAAIATTRACLAGAGVRVLGGPILPPQSQNGPEGELIAGSTSGGAFIAFYRDAQSAGRLEPGSLRRGVQRERHGAMTVLWIHPSPELRARVRTCTLRSAPTS